MMAASRLPAARGHPLGVGRWALCVGVRPPLVRGPVPARDDRRILPDPHPLATHPEPCRLNQFHSAPSFILPPSSFLHPPDRHAMASACREASGPTAFPHAGQASVSHSRPALIGGCGR